MGKAQPTPFGGGVAGRTVGEQRIFHGDRQYDIENNYQ